MVLLGLAFRVSCVHLGSVGLITWLKQYHSQVIGCKDLCPK